MRWSVPPSASPRPAREALLERFPRLGAEDATPLDDRFARGDIVRSDGTPWGADETVGAGDALWFHREIAPEDVPPQELRILHRDEHLLVLDKPHGMATMPRGAHVLASALVRLRRATGLTGLSPLHRLDRRTAGVLAFGLVPDERSSYQRLFAEGDVQKEYLARVRADGSAPEAPGPADTAAVRVGSPAAPLVVGARWQMRDRLEKPRGQLQTRPVAGEPNAITDVEVLEVEPDGAMLLHLSPQTGRTHQLRAQLSVRGLPIIGDDLYPVPRSEPEEPLQLLARTLAFTDPITGQDRTFRSARGLQGPRSLDG